MINNKLMLKLFSVMLVIAMLMSSLGACITTDPDIVGGSQSGSSSTTSSNTTSNKGTTTTGTTTSTTIKDIDENYPSDHTDKDNNGLCDDCGYDVVERLDFYNFNDLHGKFDDTDSQHGVDELTTYLENRLGIDEHVIILSTGDMWQGSSESNLTKGKLMTEWMNYLGFEAMALGNHEYDWGSDYIKANAELAEFPFLAINIYDSSTNKRVDYCEPSVMIERGGCQIGIIGAIGDCYTSISGEMTQGIYFKVGNDLTNLVKAESEKLRDQGADIIVYLLHDGGSYRTAGDTSAYYDQTLSRDGYVDLVFEGHSHSYYIFTDDYGIPHLQGGGDNNKGITHVELDVNFANGVITVLDKDYIEHSDCENLEDAPIVDELLEKYWEEIKIAYETLGYNKRYRGSTEITNLVAQLYFKAGVEKWGNEYDIVLGGAYLKLRSPYEINVGNVMYSDLQMILPFDNKIVLCSIKGSDLLSKFYNTTNSAYHIYYEGVTADDIDPNATYYIITDTYTSTYSWNNITEIEYYDENTFGRDLLAAYIKSGNWNK